MVEDPVNDDHNGYRYEGVGYEVVKGLVVDQGDQQVEGLFAWLDQLFESALWFFEDNWVVSKEAKVDWTIVGHFLEKRFVQSSVFVLADSLEKGLECLGDQILLLHKFFEVQI